MFNFKLNIPKTKLHIFKKVLNNFYTRTFFLFLLLAVSTMLTRPFFDSVQVISMDYKRKLPIYSVDTKEKNIAFTFNAAWGDENLDSILSTLREHDIKSTFFICGYWARKYPDAVKLILAEGHELANHGDTHAHVSSVSYEQNVKEIVNAHNFIKDNFDVEMNLYRAPFGEYNDTVVSAAEDNNYYIIQWDVDSLDWKDMGTEKLISQVIENKHLKNGSIVLMHIDTAYTHEGLPYIISDLKSKGYSFKKISELIYKDNYKINEDGRQYQKSS